MVNKDLETKAKEALIEMKDVLVEIKGVLKVLYGSINDMTQSLYHIIRSRRSYYDMLDGNDYPA